MSLLLIFTERLVVPVDTMYIVWHWHNRLVQCKNAAFSPYVLNVIWSMAIHWINCACVFRVERFALSICQSISEFLALSPQSFDNKIGLTKLFLFHHRHPAVFLIFSFGCPPPPFFFLPSLPLKRRVVALERDLWFNPPSMDAIPLLPSTK